MVLQFLIRKTVKKVFLRRKKRHKQICAKHNAQHIGVGFKIMRKSCYLITVFLATYHVSSIQNQVGSRALNCFTCTQGQCEKHLETFQTQYV